MTAGVYRIHCKANNAYYVGESTQVERRIRKEHIGDLRAGRHKNRELQRSWDKYGPNQFAFEIVWHLPFECEDILQPDEISRITKHHEAVIGLAMIAEGMRLMNVADLVHWSAPSPALTPGVRVKMSEQLKARWQKPDQQRKFSDAKKRMWAEEGMKERMSESISKGWEAESAKLSRSGGNHWRANQVRCVETGKVYPTSAAASKELGLKQGAVSNAIKRGLRCGGFTWQPV